jgi:uncharacterized glyoxalase superfamily protein PhnB
MVEDVNLTLEYYQDILGYEFIMGVPRDSKEIIIWWEKETPLDYAMVKQGNVEIMFQSRESLAHDLPLYKDEIMGASPTFYIEVNGVDDLYDRIKDKTRIVRGPYEAFYGMKEFYIQDCNGYIIGFAENIS